MSRITSSSVAQTALLGLQANLSRVQDLQNELSSGRRISRPSDDPSGTAASMTLRSARMAAEQYLRNSDHATARLSVTDTTLTTISDRLRATRDLMVRSRNGALGPESQDALAKQVNVLRAEVMDLYNTTYLDRPVFGGTVPGKQAIDLSTGAYLGNEAPVEVRLSPDAVIRTDVKGTDAAADVVPDLLNRISAAIGGPGLADADFADLDVALGKVARALGDVGARQARVESSKANVDSHRLDLISRISENEDVDLPETIMQLSAQQVGYQAALGTAAKIMQTSLVDFLK